MCPSPEFFAEAYRKFIHERWNEKSMDLKLLEYGDFQFPEQESKNLAKRFFFRMAAEDYSRELVNEIHGLWRLVLDLGVWDGMLKDYAKDERLYVISEFVEEKAKLALEKPYALRNQFIYSATKMAFLLDGALSGRAVPNDNTITLTTLKEWTRDWPGAKDFLLNLSRLNDEAYGNATTQFRKRSQHRIAPSIEFGVIPDTQIINGPNGVSFSYGVFPALKLKEIIGASSAQYDLARFSMHSFWKMILQVEAAA